MVFRLTFLLIFFVFISSVFAQNSGKKDWDEQNWGIGMAFRYATIPFSTETNTVGSVVPMFFFENEIFDLKGFKYGIKLHKTGNWEFQALARRHFFDAPSEIQNQIQGDNVDFGIQARYSLPHSLFLEGEIMSDIVITDGVWRGNPTANLRVVHELGGKGMRFDSYLELKVKSSKYNSWYYGLNQVDVNAGVDMSLGFYTAYNLLSNFYIYGAGKLTLLDGNARSVEIANDNVNVSVNSDMHAEIYFGFGFSNDITKPKKKELRNAAYWRVGQGFATPSTLSQILHFDATPDTNNNKLTSIFYGHPVTDELFSLPLEVYVSPGFAWHWQSDVQPNSFELNFAVLLYYTIKWPIRWRLSAGEGVSWVNKVPYMEANSLADKEYKPSNLMNYLDFSISFNIGDIIGSEPVKQWWLGYYIHHRSSIFETAQHFGRISGGSNHHTIFVMWNY